MPSMTITLRVSVAWWLWPYLQGVALVSTVTGLEPDWEKVERTVTRAITIRPA